MNLPRIPRPCTGSTDELNNESPWLSSGSRGQVDRVAVQCIETELRPDIIKTHPIAMHTEMLVRTRFHAIIESNMYWW